MPPRVPPSSRSRPSTEHRVVHEIAAVGLPPEQQPLTKPALGLRGSRCAQGGRQPALQQYSAGGPLPQWGQREQQQLRQCRWWPLRLRHLMQGPRCARLPTERASKGDGGCKEARLLVAVWKPQHAWLFVCVATI